MIRFGVASLTVRACRVIFGKAQPQRPEETAMKNAFFLVGLFLALGAVPAVAQQQKPIATTEYLPAAGKGRVVVLLSGQTGPTNYIPIAKDIAKAGYYA